MLSKIKSAVEHDDCFVVDDGSGKPFRVAKSALSPGMVERVRRMYCGGAVHMAKGGKVDLQTNQLSAEKKLEAIAQDAALLDENLLPRVDLDEDEVKRWAGLSSEDTKLAVAAKAKEQLASGRPVPRSYQEQLGKVHRPIPNAVRELREQQAKSQTSDSGRPIPDTLRAQKEEFAREEVDGKRPAPNTLKSQREEYRKSKAAAKEAEPEREVVAETPLAEPAAPVKPMTAAPVIAPQQYESRTQAAVQPIAEPSAAPSVQAAASPVITPGASRAEMDASQRVEGVSAAPLMAPVQAAASEDEPVRQPSRRLFEPIEPIMPPGALRAAYESQPFEDRFPPSSRASSPAASLAAPKAAEPAGAEQQVVAPIPSAPVSSSEAAPAAIPVASGKQAEAAVAAPTVASMPAAPQVAVGEPSAPSAPAQAAAPAPAEVVAGAAARPAAMAPAAIPPAAAAAPVTVAPPPEMPVETAQQLAGRLKQDLASQGLGKKGAAYAGAVDAAAAALSAQQAADAAAAQQAQARANALAEIERAEAQRVKDILKAKQDHQSALDAYKAQQQQALEALRNASNATVEADQVFKNMAGGVVGHIFAYLAVAVGGAAQALSKNQPNIALDGITRNIDRNVAEQRRLIGSQQSQRMQEYLLAGANIDQAQKLLEADGRNLAAAQLLEAESKAKTAEARDALGAVRAKLAADAQNRYAQALAGITANRIASIDAQAAQERLAANDRFSQAMAREHVALGRAQLAETQRYNQAKEMLQTAKLMMDETESQAKLTSVPAWKKANQGTPITLEERGEIFAAMPPHKAASMQQMFTELPDEAMPGGVQVRLLKGGEAAKLYGKMQHHGSRSLIALGKIIEVLEGRSRLPGNRFVGAQSAVLDAEVAALHDNLRFVEQMGVPKKATMEHLKELVGNPSDFTYSMLRTKEFEVTKLKELRKVINTAQEEARREYIVGYDAE